MINRQLQQIEANAQVVQERAAEFLSPGQLDILKTYQGQVASVAKVGIEMSKMLLEGKK